MTELTPNVLPSGEKCGTCRFAGTHVHASNSTRTLVRCLRYPPARLSLVDRFDRSSPLQAAYEDTAFPVLTWDDWCGEYAPRQADQHE